MTFFFIFKKLYVQDLEGCFQLINLLFF